MAGERPAGRSRIDYWAFAALLAGLSVVTHNVFAQLSHEDPGRDVYATWRFMHGELPYRDYHWTYGPLFLVYSGASFKLLGTSLWSALVSFKFAQAVSCVFVFLAARRLFGSPFALAGVALHYFLGEIGHTFNHGLVMAFISLWLWILVEEGVSPLPLTRKGFRLLALVLLGLYLSKFNYGLGCTAGTLLFILLKHVQAPASRFPWGRLSFLAALWPGLALLPYVWLMWDVPLDRIMLCHAAGRGKIYLKFPVSWDQFWITPIYLFSNPKWALHAFAVENFFLVLGAAATTGWGAWRLTRWLRDRSLPFPVLPVLSPAVLYIAAHEFLMGSWNPASLGYHASGFYGLVLAGLGRLVPPLPLATRRVTLRHAASFLLVALWTTFAAKDAVFMRWGGRGHFLDHPRAGIWSWGGSHPKGKYSRTLQEVSRTLESLTDPQDACTVLPRGSLYFFLAQRRRATWLEEADAQFLTDQPTEEARMIRELENQPVEWVLFSNFARYLTTSNLNNNFGEHYARDLLRHVQSHYEEVARVPDGPLHVYQDIATFRNEDHQIQFLRRLPPGSSPSRVVLPVKIGLADSASDR